MVLYLGTNNSMDLLNSLGLGGPSPTTTSNPPDAGQQSLMNDFGLGSLGGPTTNGEGSVYLYSHAVHQSTLFLITGNKVLCCA